MWSKKKKKKEIWFSDLVWSSSKSDPPIIQGDDKLPSVQLHVDLSASKQHQRVNRHHAAVPDENATRFHLLMVNQVRAVVVANLVHKEQKGEAYFSYKLFSLERIFFSPPNLTV